MDEAQRVLEGHIWAERGAIIAQSDLAWSWADDGTVAWVADAETLLQQAEERLLSLLVDGLSLICRGHLATAARVLHWVFLQAGCPLQHRASYWMDALTQWRGLETPAVISEWAYAASDSAMHLAKLGDEEGAATRLRDVAQLYRRHRSSALRRALGKAIAACGRLGTHWNPALRRLAALLIFYGDEEYARYFAISAKDAVLDAAAGGAWALAEELFAVMEQVAARRPAGILLRQIRSIREALSPRLDGVVRQARLPWPRLRLRQQTPICLCDELEIEMFKPQKSIACAWSRAGRRIVSLRRNGSIEVYLWNGVPTDHGVPALTISSGRAQFDPGQGIEMELLQGGARVRITPPGITVALP